MKAINKESGLVSILTVIMFMIFISILVVGFIKIMTDEQRQTSDNDLSASALTAAQSGIEDAKRLILFCQKGDATYGDKTTGRCKDVLDSKKNADECSVFRGGAGGLFNAMKIDYVGGEARVGEDEFNQYYTCLSILADPTDVVKPISEGKSLIIPMDVNGSFNSVKIKWSSPSGSYSMRGASLGSDFPPRGSWSGLAGTPRPPLLRVQVIPFTLGAISLDAAEQGSDTLFLVPASSSTVANVTRGVDARGAPGTTRSGAVPLIYTACTIGSFGYDCNMRVDGFAPLPEKYYLRLSLMYGNTSSVAITPFDTTTGSDRTFNNVQYLIDVTGRANDVYRRVQSRVSPASSAIFPEYALDTSDPICKDILVADATFTSYCP